MRRIYILLVVVSIIGLISCESATVSEARLLKEKVCSDVTSSSKAEREADLDKIRNSDGDKTLIQALIKGDSVDPVEFVQRYGQKPIIFAAFGVLSLLGWYFCTYTCACQGILCPPCRSCCKCCRNEDEYSSFGLKFPVFGGMIFMIWVIVVAVIGVAQAPKIENANKSVLCSTITTLDSLTFGESENNWKGLNELLEQLMDVATSTTIIQNSIDSTFQTTANIALNQNIISTNFATLEQGYNYTSAINLISSNSTSLFLSNPAYTNIVQDIQDQVDSSQQIKQAIDDLDAIGQDLKTDNITDLINSANLKLQDAVDNMAQSMIDVDSGYSQFKDGFKLGTLSITIVFGAFIGIALLSFIALLYSLVKKNYKFRFGLHLSWFFFSLIMVVTFIIGAVFSFIGTVGVDACWVIDKSLNDQAYAQTYIPSDIYDQVVVCSEKLGGDGDILKQNDLDIITQIDDFRAKIDSYQNTSGTQSENLEALTNLTNLLQTSLIANLESIKTDSSVNISGTIVYELFNLQNLITTVENTCTTNGGIKFKQSGTCPQATSQSSCYWVGRVTSNSSDLFQNTSLSCVNQSLANQIVGWRDEKYNEYTKRLDASNAIKSEFSRFKDDLVAFATKVDNMIAQIQVTLDKITDPTTGVVSQLNCQFLGDSLDLFFESICINFILNLRKLADRIIILSFGMFFGSFFIYCTAWRYVNQEKLDSKDKKKSHYSDSANQNQSTQQFTDRSLNLELPLRNQNPAQLSQMIPSRNYQLGFPQGNRAHY